MHYAINTKQVDSRSLLLQGLPQLTKQPMFSMAMTALVREGRNQINLLLGERLDPGARRTYHD